MNLTFTDDSWSEYAYWQQTDKHTLKKINQLLKGIKRDPFDGVGKPEIFKILPDVFQDIAFGIV